MLDGVLRILKRYLLVVIQLCTTTSLPYLFEGRKWPFAVVVVLEFSLENSAVAKVMSFLFMERAPPRLIVLPFGALTFASIGVLLGTLWLLIAYGQDLLRTIGLRLLALCLVLGFLDLLSFFLLLSPAS